MLPVGVICYFPPFLPVAEACHQELVNGGERSAMGHKAPSHIWWGGGGGGKEGVLQCI